MKHTLLVLFFMIFCNNFLFAEEALKKEPSTPDKSISTAPATQAQKLQPFRAINFASLGNLLIRQSTQESLTLEAEEDILPLLKVYVKDNTLYINMKDASKHTQTKINYYLNIKDIKSISSFDSSTISIQEPLLTEELNLDVNSLGTANINIQVKKLNLKIGGGSKVEARGKALDQDISITGAGEFHGQKLTGTNALVSIQEAGFAKVNASETLKVKITGDGNIQYCGKPSLDREVSGKGRVEPLENCQ